MRLAFFFSAAIDCERRSPCRVYFTARFTDILSPMLRHSLRGTKDGYGGLYRGIVPTITGMVPYAGLAFTSNEFLRSLTIELTGDLGTVSKLLCGGVSGVIAQSTVYPLDITRRRMQTSGLVRGGVAGTMDTGFENVKETTLGTLRKVYMEGGLRGLFKGLTMNWIKGPAAFAISFTCFDKIKELMEEGGFNVHTLINT